MVVLVVKTSAVATCVATSPLDELLPGSASTSGMVYNGCILYGAELRVLNCNGGWNEVLMASKVGLNGGLCYLHFPLTNS